MTKTVRFEFLIVEATSPAAFFSNLMRGCLKFGSIIIMFGPIIILKNSPVLCNFAEKVKFCIKKSIGYVI